MRAIYLQQLLVMWRTSRLQPHAVSPNVCRMRCTSLHVRLVLDPVVATVRKQPGFRLLGRDLDGIVAELHGLVEIQDN